MNYPDNYTYGLDEPNIQEHFPNLQEGINFYFTSIRTDIKKFAEYDYNCCAWALHRTNKWLQIDSGFLEELDLDETNFDVSVERYANEVYARYGFEVCENGDLEVGFEKIVLYGDGLGFTHVARQLTDGTWTSKIGHWEDISHQTVDDVIGDWYGIPQVYMRRALGFD